MSCSVGENIWCKREITGWLVGFGWFFVVVFWGVMVFSAKRARSGWCSGEKNGRKIQGLKI